MDGMERRREEIVWQNNVEREREEAACIAPSHPVTGRSRAFKIEAETRAKDRSKALDEMRASSAE